MACRDVVERRLLVQSYNYMLIETYNAATDLIQQIESVKDQLRQVGVVLDGAKENKVRTRIQGMDFDLPKAAFKTEVNKKKAALEAQLTTLQTAFDAL